MSKTNVDQIIKKADQEIERLESNPEELKKIDEFLNNIGDNYKPVYAKVTRKIFHDFLQVCKEEKITIGEKLTELVTEYSKKNFPAKRPYNPAQDYKALQARNND